MFLAETTLHQTVLKSSFDGDLESVATNYEKILGQDLDIPLQSMATAALIANKPKIFVYCLEKGVAFDQDIDRAAARVNNPEMLKYLYEADWRKIKSDHSSLAKLLTSSVGKSQHCVAFLLNQGAHILPETLSTAAFKPPSGADAATMALLLSRGGQQKDSGALQLAAGRDRLDIVKLLLAASANIDEIPANAPGDRMDGWPQTALHEAIAGSRTDVVRLLLDQGARWDLPDSKGRTALDLAESRGQGEIVELIKAHKKADAAGKE